MNWTTTIVLVFLAACPVRGGGQELSGGFAFVGATVVDSATGESLPDAVVLVHGERIVAVGTRGEVVVPSGVAVLDLTGKWLVPGLVDAHIHFFQSGSVYTRPDVVDLRHVRSYEEETKVIDESLPATFRRWLASGVTAVVDVGGPFWNFEVRERARETGLSPRVAVAGPLISTVSRPQMDIGDPPIIRAQTPERAREMVRKQLAHKPDLMKIWYILGEGGPAENLPIAKAVIDESHAGGVRVAVHATQLEAARLVVEAGADILVHSIDDALLDSAFLELLKERNVLFVSTLVVLEGYLQVMSQQVHRSEWEMKYGDPQVMATWHDLAGAMRGTGEAERLPDRIAKMRTRLPMMAANFKLAADAGVRVAMGTDAGNIGTVHGPSVFRELELLSEAGLSPAQILKASTFEAAHVFSPRPAFGRIAPGRLADMLVLDGDPLASSRNLERIHWVVKGGLPLEPALFMAPNPEWVVQGQLEAYNARDVDRFLSFYAQDVEVRGLPSGDAMLSGVGQMRGRYAGLFAENPELHCNLLNRTVQGPIVVDHELVTGVRGRPRIRAMAMYEVLDGLIRKIWFMPR